MTSISILAVSLIVAFRTALYGIWCFKGKNILGGIAISFLSISAIVVSIIFYIKSNT